VNQLEQARKGIATTTIKEVASSEGIEPQCIVEEMAAGHIIIPQNKHHTTISPIGIGKQPSPPSALGRDYAPRSMPISAPPKTIMI